MSASYLPYEVKKKSARALSGLRRILLILFPVFFFLGAVWLIYTRFHRDPLQEIEILLENKRFPQAANFAISQLNKDPLARPRWLMYAVIATQSAGNMHENKVYETVLRNEDTSGIFLKESYLRRMHYKENQKYFLSLWLSYLTDFSGALKDESFQNALKNALDSGEPWTIISENDFAGFWGKVSVEFPGLLRRVSGDNLQLREKPDSSGKVLMKLPKNEKLLARKKGESFSVGAKKGNWLFVLTSSQQQGWVFDGYLD